MNRRSFLKLLGIGAVAPSVIKASAKQKDFLLEHGDEVGEIKQLKAAALGPIEFDGVGYYIAFVHPRRAYQLKVLSARDKYRHESHIGRWEKRYGEKSPSCEGEVGTFGGVTFHKS